MEFSQFKTKLQKHVAGMTARDTDHLFTVNLDKDELWNLYLDSFPAGTNEIFRERREHDCSACRHFVKSFGNVVSIKNNVLTTIWDFEAGGEYEPVVKAMAAYVKSFPVSEVFVTKSNIFGVDKNYEDDNGKAITWEHLHVVLPKKFVNVLGKDTEGTIQGRLRDVRNVFKRSLDEISNDAMQTVLELIAQNSLYKGEEWEGVLAQFLKYQKAYLKLNDSQKELYAWEQSLIAGPVIGKIRNHSIGVLLVDISEGADLDEAVRRYEAIVAPSNYKRPKAIFTKKMLEDARQKLTDLGYLDSLSRRYAVLDDITVNNILFANKDAAKKLAGGDVFGEMESSIALNPKNFSKVEEVTIQQFVKDILPTANTVEVLLENKHLRNTVSLIAPEVKDSKSMFKWGNNFSWAYSGNITDSMKERVKSAGGKVDGVLRFSIQWNENHDNENDFDAHCTEPNGNEIYYGNKGMRHPSSGMLDVDIVSPSRQTKDGIAVENITWENKAKMREGTYKFFVRNFRHNGGRSGFSAEIEFDGQIYSFAYNRELREKEDVIVATVNYSKEKGFTISEKIPSALASRKIWGLDSNQFHPVSVIMYSPNYWDAQDGIGNKHYFFMLKDCENPENPNGFFNEFLKEDLLEHKRVFEALGSKMRVNDSEHQLSGIGFSSTQRNSVVVKVEGHVNRTLKVTI